MRTLEEIQRDIAKCENLIELDRMIASATMEEFYMYHYEFLFGAYLLGLATSDIAREDFETIEKLRKMIKK